MITNIILWIIFGCLFLTLSIFHYCESKKKIKEFNYTVRPHQGNSSVQFFSMDIDQPVQNLTSGLNKYISDLNGLNMRMNRIAAAGYLLASLTAFFSLYLI